MVSVRSADDGGADDGRPHAVGSYATPLLLIVVVCAAFLIWRRRHRGSGLEQSYQGLGGSRNQGVRLSTDDDGPPAQAFISNDPSDDELSPSLPSVALPTIRHPAHQDPLQGASSGNAISEPVFSRRSIRELSRRQVGAVEVESSEEEEDVHGADIFKIGDNEEGRVGTDTAAGGNEGWDR